ncbi:MAG: hypothetical protein CVU56_10210, partial [Deltaproteobacteria bacterium HGW-Deltaproteobacteria-14]
MRPLLVSLTRLAIPLGLVAAASGCYPYGYYQDAPAEPAPTYVDGPGYDAADDYYDDIEGESVAGLDDFYEPLTEYGSWYDDGDLGYVWTPYDDGWEPYSDGYWSYTRYGWTWISNRPYGWAVCHYGRWYFDGRWHWVPDTTWGPAWVDWRADGDYVAWAPAYHPRRPRPAHVDHWHAVHRQHLHDRNVARWYTSRNDARAHGERGRPIQRWGHNRSGARWSQGPRREWVGDHVETTGLDRDRSGRRPAGHGGGGHGGAAAGTNQGGGGHGGGGGHAAGQDRDGRPVPTDAETSREQRSQEERRRAEEARQRAAGERGRDEDDRRA